MNFLGHTAVAVACGYRESEQVLGAVLPDLMAMAAMGPLLDRGALSDAVVGGVECHHRADAAFHAHPTFVAGSGRLRTAAAEAGLGRGPTRAVGHAGWELLLDGAIGDDADVVVAFRGALAAGAAVLPALGPEAAARWTALTDALVERRIWDGYGDPAQVAVRLERMLRGRPRLAFPASQMEAVAGVLAEAAPGVRASAETVVADVTAACRA